ncbi:UPF0236 family transposase-like protein [Caldibacillus debilis]|uniref:UPF0236 family transposase-like protein n=1 Tax=Caldibacillus debilis TaxID=301148 RepID=UPI0022854712|nr:UPF0236 family protein [Caldibacillus debilis]
MPRDKEPVSGRVLFVEVDGLYIKRQGKRKKGKEEKIAAVHQGWERSGNLVNDNVLQTFARGLPALRQILATFVLPISR